MSNIKYGITVSILFLILVIKTQAQFSINLESGALFTNLNDIRKGSDGDIISLKNDLETPVSPFLRLRASYLLNEKHFFSVLYAPLRLTLKGEINRDIQFDGETYAANKPLEAVYQFNSYRLTYNRVLVNTDQFMVGIGLSAKVRYAGFTLKNQDFDRGDFSVGFVPLINFIAEWKVSDRWSTHFFGDGLVASRGRAFDLALTGAYKFNEHIYGTFGYRYFEGGSDGTNDYNFVQLNFAIIGLNYMF